MIMMKKSANVAGIMRIGTVCLIFLATSCAVERGRGEVRDYLTRVKAYADAMIKGGRDTYGAIHSPLFASALNRKTMRIGAFEAIAGVRINDRSLGGANPQTDVDLYAILYRLTELSGQKRYAREANASLEFFFSHCQSPATGLMTWGEHIYWDFEQEKMAGNLAVHEIKGEWPYWNECYQLAPDACWRFAIGQWDHQIADKQTGDFSRHADWANHGPQTGADFPRYAGQMIANWADAYSRKENADRRRRSELVTAISILVARMQDNIKKSPSGYLLAGTDTAHSKISWPRSSLELARCLWKFAPHMNDDLAKQMKGLALNLDHQFHRAPHTINSGGSFATTLDSKTGEPRSRSMNKPYSGTWGSGYGYGTHAKTANDCVARFRQIEKSHPRIAGKYRELFLSAAKQYLATTPDVKILLKPGSIAEVITLLINSHGVTGRKEFLERADYFGRLGVTLFLDDGLPLPKATNLHDHYESITGGPLFMHSLLKLHEAQNSVR